MTLMAETQFHEIWNSISCQFPNIQANLVLVKLTQKFTARLGLLDFTSLNDWLWLIEASKINSQAGFFYITTKKPSCRSKLLTLSLERANKWNPRLSDRQGWATVAALLDGTRCHQNNHLSTLVFVFVCVCVSLSLYLSEWVVTSALTWLDSRSGLGDDQSAWWGAMVGDKVRGRRQLITMWALGGKISHKINLKTHTKAGIACW